VRNNGARVRLHALIRPWGAGNMQLMMKRYSITSRKISILCGLLLFLEAPRAVKGQPAPATIIAFDSYSKTVELRLAQQHRSPGTFLASSDISRDRLRRGELIFEHLTPPTTAELPGALLHHWRGTAFAPGANASDFEHLMREFNAYPQHFSPEVLQARTTEQDGNHLRAWMRVRQTHVITVVMDATSCLGNSMRIMGTAFREVPKSTRSACPGRNWSMRLLLSKNMAFFGD